MPDPTKGTKAHTVERKLEDKQLNDLLKTKVEPEDKVRNTMSGKFFDALKNIKDYLDVYTGG
jgi:hypothetical protein